MRDNVFLFKFATKGENKKVFIGGQWNFDRALLVLAELIGVGDIKK